MLASALAVVALVLRIAAEARNTILATGDYDEGVYFSASRWFTTGVMPYRDFVFIQPAGSVLVLTPFTGALSGLFGTEVGFLAARFAAAGCGAVTTAMVFFAARRLGGRAAAITAAALYATMLAAIIAEGRVMLEPFMLAAGVGGVLLFLERRSRRALITAGVLLGIAATIKITGAVFLLALALGVLIAERQRVNDLATAVVTAVATTFVISLPFLWIAGPGPYLRQAVLSQLTRPDGANLPGNIDGATARLGAFSSWGPLGSHLPLPTWFVALATLVTAAAIVRLVLLRSSAAITWAVIAVVPTLAFLVGPSFYSQYPVLAAPGLVIALGVLLATACDRIRLPHLAVGVAGVLAIALCGAQLKSTYLSPVAPVNVAFERAIRDASARGCVFVDLGHIALMQDLLPQDGAGQPLVDPFGELLYRNRDVSDRALVVLRSPDAQASLRDAISDCPTVALRDPMGAQFAWGPDTVTWLTTTYDKVFDERGSTVWVRRGG